MKKEKNIVMDLGERGKYNPNNKLNDLTGKEWLKFTKSWFILRPPKRKNEELLHPAKFPENLVKDFITFFTKKGAWILDPFMGTGSTLLAANNVNRNCVGIELSKKYFATTIKRVEKLDSKNKIIPLSGNSLNLDAVLKNNDLSSINFDYVITSPPYWNQLRRSSIRQKERNEKGLDTSYSNNADDLGNIEDYDSFLEMQAKVFDKVFEYTKVGSYLTIITNNVYFSGKLYPLAFDTASSLTKRNKKSWVLKDERIWLQDDKKLIALGVNSAWVGNRHHQYCLIFRKES